MRKKFRLPRFASFRFLLPCLALYVAAAFVLFSLDGIRYYLIANALITLMLLPILLRWARRGAPELRSGWAVAAATAVTALSFANLWTAFIPSPPVCALLTLLSAIPAFIAMRAVWNILGSAANRLGRCPAPESPASQRRCAAAVLLCAVIVLGCTWCFSWPYRSSPDTAYQSAQIHGQIPLNDIHAIGHTLFLKLLLGVVDNFAIVVFVQIVMYCALAAASASLLARRGVPLAPMLALFTVFFCNYIVSISAVKLWKDAPYAFFVGMITLLTIRWTEEPDRFRGRGTWHCAALGFCLAAAYLVRQNGIVILIVMGAMFLISMLRRRMFRQIAATFLTAAALICATLGCAYGPLDAQSPEENGFPYQVFGSGLAAIVNDESVTEEELARIGDLLPVDWMREEYVPWSHTDLIWHRDGAADVDKSTSALNNGFVMALGRNHWKAIRLYFELMPRHFLACARDVIQNTLCVWGHFGLKRGVVYFDSVTLLTLLLMAYALARRRGSDKSFWVLMPVLLNTLSIAISTITNEERYLLPTNLLFPLLLLYLLSATPERRPRALD